MIVFIARDFHPDGGFLMPVSATRVLDVNPPLGVLHASMSCPVNALLMVSYSLHIPPYPPLDSEGRGGQP